MERIFGYLPFIVVYLDDLLVFSSTDEDHLAHLRILFDRLHTYGVTLNGKKSHIWCKKVNYLGFT